MNFTKFGNGVPSSNISEINRKKWQIKAGVSIDLIAESTGLTIDEIGNLV